MSEKPVLDREQLADRISELIREDDMCSSANFLLISFDEEGYSLVSWLDTHEPGWVPELLREIADAEDWDPEEVSGELSN